MASQEEYLDRLLKGLGADSLVQTDTEKSKIDEKPDKVFVDNTSEESLIEPDLMAADIAELLQETTGALESMEDLPEVDFADFTEVATGAVDVADMVDFADFTEAATGAVDDTDAADFADFSEEDIDRMLRNAQEETEYTNEGAPGENQDLYDLLQQDSADSSQQIQELLWKDDNNEVIAPEIFAAMQSGNEAEALEEAIYSEAETEQVIKNASKSARAAQRREKKELRDSRKRELREKKRLDKLAQKEEKASRNAKKKYKEIDLVPVTENAGFQVVEPEAASENETGLEDMFASLDSIDALGAMETADIFDADTTVDFMDLGGAVPTQEEKTEEQLAADALFQELTADASMMELFDMTAEEAVTPDIMDVSSPSGKQGTVKTREKKSIFNRFLDFLTEEEEEPEDSRGNEDVSMSSENENILKEMDAESGKKKKKKKKGEKAKATEEENGEEGKDEGKKAKKPKKPKKEKPPKPEKPEIPASKLSKKKVLVVAFIGISACAIIVVIASVLSEYTNKREARQAYYNQDYQTCYQNLFGKDLNESEQVMFHRSEVILKVRLWLREYEILSAEGAELEALDCLIQAVYAYPDLFEYSNKWNAGTDVETIYKELLAVLENTYHVSEEQALAIAEIVSDVEYTRAVTAIVSGMSYEQWLEQKGNPTGKEDTDEPVGRLPEEDDIKVEIEFIDNV